MIVWGLRFKVLTRLLVAIWEFPTLRVLVPYFGVLLSLTRTQSPVSRDAEHSDFAMHAYLK